jgi:hypothetical protein
MKKAITALVLPCLISLFSISSAEAKKVLYGHTTNTPQQTAKINAALQKYNLKKYKESAQGLEDVDSHGGCCDRVHYFLALNYLNLNQTVLAQMHYQWVMSNSKNARLRQYADYGNEQLAYYQSHRTYGGQGSISPAMSFG